MSANPEALPGWYHRRSDDNSEENEQSDSSTVSGGKSHGTTDDELLDTAQTTTGGDQEDQTPVVVWEAANRLEAEIVAGRLHSQNIPAIIRGESLGAIYGLTTGSLAAATVLVPGPLAEKALEILAVDVEWVEGDEDEFLDDEAGDRTDDDHADAPKV